MKLRAIWKEYSPYSKMVITVGVVLVFTTLLTVIATALAAALYGIQVDSLPALMGDLSNPVGISIMKIVQAASSLGVFVFPALFLGFVFSDSVREFLSWRKPADGMLLLWASGIMLLALPAINAMAEWNNAIRLPAFLAELEQAMRATEDRAAAITEAFMVMNGAKALGVNIVVIALLPALGEELLFRGVLQRIFSSWSGNRHTGIWVAAFLFSAMHMQFYGFFPRMLLGALFGYFLVWSGSLWVPVIAHFVNNATAVLLMFFYQRNELPFNPDEWGTSGTDAIWVIASLVVVVSGIYYFWKRSEKPSAASTTLS